MTEIDLWKVIAMKRKKTGFTLVELLTVLAIITMLIGLLVPAMATVRRFAKETKQKAQLTTIGLALTAFRDDYGDYPPSNEYSDSSMITYCGAQKLAEALLGRDLLGFHPDSTWGGTGNDLTLFYNPATLHERRGRYLELGTANAFWVGDTGTGGHDGLFLDLSFSGNQLNPDTFVICDVFGTRKINLQINLPKPKIVKAGTPILYYRANTSSRNMEADDVHKRIYSAHDNLHLIKLGVLTPDGISGKPHQLGVGDGWYFYDEAYKVLDPKATAASGIPWPHRPDSYILISAGMDGEYGTGDDITNFGN